MTTANQTINYYVNSPTYLTGPLGGTCHFGYTQPNEAFDLQTDLKAMERLLGETIALPAGSVVLDAGSGYGRVASTLNQEFGYRVIGVDLIQERLQEAVRHTVTRDQSGSIGFLRGNYGILPLKDSSVSAIYTMETLVHADPLEVVLADFRRVLKPGGKLVLFEYSVPERASLDPVRKKITDIMVYKTGMASIERFTHNAFPNLLQAAQFSNVTVRDISRNVWPTWRWLFWRAIRENWTTILQGKIMQSTNLAGSLFIWPYRHQLGYKVVTAIKPLTS